MHSQCVLAQQQKAGWTITPDLEIGTRRGGMLQLALISISTLTFEFYFNPPSLASVLSVACFFQHPVMASACCLSCGVHGWKWLGTSSRRERMGREVKDAGQEELTSMLGRKSGNINNELDKGRRPRYKHDLPSLKAELQKHRRKEDCSAWQISKLAVFCFVFFRGQVKKAMVG